MGLFTAEEYNDILKMISIEKIEILEERMKFSKVLFGHLNSVGKTRLPVDHDLIAIVYS